MTDVIKIRHCELFLEKLVDVLESLRRLHYDDHVINVYKNIEYMIPSGCNPCPWEFHTRSDCFSPSRLLYNRYNMVLSPTSYPFGWYKRFYLNVSYYQSSAAGNGQRAENETSFVLPPMRRLHRSPIHTAARSPVSYSFALLILLGLEELFTADEVFINWKFHQF